MSLVLSQKQFMGNLHVQGRGKGEIKDQKWKRLTTHQLRPFQE